MAAGSSERAILRVMQITTSRLDGLAAAVGGLLSAGVMVFAPSFGGLVPEQLTAVAGSGGFVAANLLDLLAMILIVVGALGVVRALAGDPFAVAARPLVIIGGAVALVGDALALVPYRLIAENYVLSDDTNRQSVTDAGFSMNATLFGLGELQSLLLAGVVPVLLGVAILRTRVFPSWLACAALAGGAVQIVLSVLGLIPDAGADLGVLDTIASLLVVAVLVAAGALLWRRAPE